MKKRISAVFLIFILCFSFGMTAFAQEEGIVYIPDSGLRLVDMAGLLGGLDKTKLLSILDEISERQQFDIVVVTADTLGGKTPMEYADNFYDNNGYGFGESKDGVLLLVSMEDRDWWISTAGYGMTVFTDAGITYISEQFMPALSDGDYVGAFTYFAHCCDEFITQARSDKPYDIGNLPKEPYNLGFSVFIALIIGFVFAAVTTAIMGSNMKTVRFQPAASDYVKSGSMKVTDFRDLFLYAHIDRVERPKDSESKGSLGGSEKHTSSSGTSHGGGGGKF